MTEINDENGWVYDPGKALENLRRAESAEAERDDAIRIARIFRKKVAYLTLTDKSYDEFNEACKVLATLTEKRSVEG